MRELRYGKYIIFPSAAKNQELYRRRGPHLAKCACPGCQNFFKAAAPYRAELEAAAAPLGVSWDKPDFIEVLDARDGSVFYRLRYTFFGTGELPKKWSSEKTALGSVNLRTPEADYRLNEAMRFSFSRAGEKRLCLELRAELPWLMETLNCIYDFSVKKDIKPQPSRLTRIYRSARHIYDAVKKGRR